MWIAADVPTTADWVSAWGQVGGAAATAAAVAYALSLGRRDRRWRRADQADRDMSQARLVTVDLDERYLGIFDNGTLDIGLRVIVTNNSTEPIFDVEVLELRCESFPELGWEHRSDGDPLERDRIPVVNPGSGLRSEVNYVSPVPGEGEVPAPDGVHVVTIGFTDARGLRWTRTGTGAPVRQDPVSARRLRLQWPWTRD